MSLNGLQGYLTLELPSDNRSHGGWQVLSATVSPSNTENCPPHPEFTVVPR